MTRRTALVGPCCMLTRRDTEILRYLALGHDKAWIATALHQTVRTIRNEVLKLMRKIQAHSPRLQ